MAALECHTLPQRHYFTLENNQCSCDSAAVLGMQKAQDEARINCSGSAILPVPPLTLKV